jgi:hypothetical protein
MSAQDAASAGCIRCLRPGQQSGLLNPQTSSYLEAFESGLAPREEVFVGKEVALTLIRACEVQHDMYQLFQR